MKGAKSKAASSTRKGDSKLAVKKPTKKEKQAAKDPNMPKRPPTAFFVFMEDFRKEYKEKNPQIKAVSVVGKAGGVKWKSLTEKEKASFVAKANKRKQEYQRKMDAYNNKSAGGDDDDDESDKSKSEVNDEDDEDGSGEEEEDDD